MGIIKQIAKEAKGMLLDGIGASEHIDSSGEILDIKGCDIKDIHDGVAVINYEHKDDTPTDTIGRLVYGKKIFSVDDCEDERQLMYWKKSGAPFIYIIGELMDQDGHTGAADAAAIVRHYHSRGLPIVARWSIEGSTLDKDKSTNRLKRSIFKRIALTLKPCNKDATSGVLFDPFDKKGSKPASSLKSIVDKVDKFEHPAYTKIGGAMEIECMPLIDVMKTELSKEEELREKLKNVVKAWDGSGDLKAFVKSQLPEISDDFLKQFADVVDNFKVKVKKFEALENVISKLVKKVDETVNPKQPMAPIEFAGKQIKPGSASIFLDKGRLAEDADVIGKDTPVSLLSHNPDDQTFTAVPKSKVNGWTDKDLLKIPMTHPHLRVDEFPEEINTSPIVNGGVHGFHLHPEAAKMVHGMELDPKSPLAQKHHGHGINKKVSYWTKTPAGKLVFVKPDHGYLNDFGSSAKEAAFHNVARDFFGLGHYLPTVAAVRHPKSGQLHTVVEAVPGEHTEVEAFTNEIPNKQEHINTLNKLGKAGELDKLALMDTIMANDDRHHQNYLYTPGRGGDLKMIDHGMAFSKNPNEALMSNLPDYLSKYHNLEEQNYMHQPMAGNLHPETTKWLMSLNPVAFKRSLRANGVPLAFANESVRRLQSMQNVLMANPGAKKFDVYNAIKGIKMA